MERTKAIPLSESASPSLSDSASLSSIREITLAESSGGFVTSATTLSSWMREPGGGGGDLVFVAANIAGEGKAVV